ncbi:MAG: PEP-CTERM sorting domain-containing protein [Verrucomicrobiota bacterium]|jgi:hypothetical protein
MKNTKLTIGSAACAVAMLVLGNNAIQAQNLLVDPGFESHGTAVGDWITFGNSSFSTAEARTGTYSMLNNGTGGYSVPGSYETFASAPGLEYDLTGYGLVTAAPGAGSFACLQITFWSGANGTGANLGTVATSPGNAQQSNYLTPSSPLNTWTFLDTGIAQAPAGAQSLQVFTIVIDATPTAAYFDDLSLTQVPEPSVWALMSMGLGIPFYFLRRRNS